MVLSGMGGVFLSFHHSFSSWALISLLLGGILSMHSMFWALGRVPTLLSAFSGRSLFNSTSFSLYHLCGSLLI